MAKKVEPVVKKVETVVKGKKGKPVVALPILVPIAVVAAAVVPDNKKPVKANKISPPSKKAKLADAPVVAQAPIVKIPPPSKKVKVAATPVVVQAPIVVPAPIVDVKDNKKELVKGISRHKVCRWSLGRRFCSKSLDIPRIQCQWQDLRLHDELDQHHGQQQQ